MQLQPSEFYPQWANKGLNLLTVAQYVHSLYLKVKLTMVFKQKGFIHVVESPGFKLGFSKINTRSVAEEGGDIFFSSTLVIDRFFFLRCILSIWNKNISIGRQHIPLHKFMWPKVGYRSNNFSYIFIPIDSAFLSKLIFKRNGCLDKVIFLLEAIFFLLIVAVWSWN